MGDSLVILSNDIDAEFLLVQEGGVGVNRVGWRCYVAIGVMYRVGVREGEEAGHVRRRGVVIVDSDVGEWPVGEDGGYDGTQECTSQGAMW